MDFPSLHGNWIDLCIVFIVLFYLCCGWGRGLVLGIIDLLGFITSFIAALKSYSFFGSLLVANFSLPKGISNASGFLLGGILAEMVFSFLVTIFAKKILRPIYARQEKEKAIKNFLRVDKYLGFIPAIGEALILVTFLLTLLVTLPVNGQIKKDIVYAKIGGPLVVRAQRVEKEINTIFGEAVDETLTFLTISANPINSEKIDLNFTQTEIKIDESAEKAMFNLVNLERTTLGLPLLIYSSELTNLARDYGKDMFGRGFFSHYDPEGQSPFVRMDKKKISYNIAGENLALAPNTQLAHQGLMNSAGHRANIMSKDFKKIGIGVIDGGIYGEIFVQEFTD